MYVGPQEEYHRIAIQSGVDEQKEVGNTVKGPAELAKMGWEN